MVCLFAVVAIEMRLTCLQSTACCSRRGHSSKKGSLYYLEKPATGSPLPADFRGPLPAGFGCLDYFRSGTSMLQTSLDNGHVRA